jgi:acyl-CoA reductase-like NAD-dependent aldehyde dehydrogenase
MPDRIADVRALLRACARLVERRTSFAAAIVESSGLSPEGVELALTRHLEIDATDAELESLVASAGTARRVAVILSSNVFVGALRAIAIALAATDDVIVRPSRRDPAFARLLVEELADPRVRIEEAFDVASLRDGEIHVYGSDATIAAVREAARVPVIAHGHGMGIAWVSRAAPLDIASALAADVIAFDQRGCLSPRVAFVEGDLARAKAFAERLHSALEQVALAVPRGPMPAEDRAAADRYIATMTYACDALVGPEHAIGIAPPGAPIVLPPAYRHVHVAACTSREEARALYAPFARTIVAVGTDDPTGPPAEAEVSIAPPWARISPLGAMQRPRLDGPVDRRSIR